MPVEMWFEMVVKAPHVTAAPSHTALLPHRSSSGTPPPSSNSGVDGTSQPMPRCTSWATWTAASTPPSSSSARRLVALPRADTPPSAPLQHPSKRALQFSPPVPLQWPPMATVLWGGSRNAILCARRWSTCLVVAILKDGSRHRSACFDTGCCSISCCRCFASCPSSQFGACVCVWLGRWYLSVGRLHTK